MEIGEKAEVESASEHWQRVIRKQGASYVTSVFPTGKFHIGRVSFENNRELWRTLPIFESNKVNSLSPDKLDFVAGVLIDVIPDELVQNPPANTDILSICDPEKELNKHKWAYDTKQMNFAKNKVGINYLSPRSDVKRLWVSHLIVLPKDLAQEFLEDSLNNPNLPKELMDQFLDGVDIVAPRQKAEKVLIFTNIKRPGGIFANTPKSIPLP